MFLAGIIMTTLWARKEIGSRSLFFFGDFFVVRHMVGGEWLRLSGITFVFPTCKQQMCTTIYIYDALYPYKEPVGLGLSERP